MSLFNFITDECLRASLESDYSELLNCLECHAWKAAHVLSGSLIEALLIDSLVSANVIPRAEALQLDLGNAILKAKQAGMISAKSSDLCSAIKAYRNLIHPGRSVRLGEHVDGDSATVASSLVKIIVGEVAKKRLENYGYTAEQLLAKIERDASIDGIFKHLLKDMQVSEVERLLVTVIPARHLTASEDVDTPGELLRTFASCFRTAFDQAHDGLKAKVAGRFVETLKQGSEYAVSSYCHAFFRASDLQYLVGDDVALVRDFLLARCEKRPSVELFVVLSGIGAHLEKAHVNKFVDALVKLATSSSELNEEAKAALINEHRYTSDATDKLIAKRLGAWSAAYGSRNNERKVALVEEIRTVYEGEVPF